MSWCGECREDAEGSEPESWKGTSVSEDTTPRVAKPERWILVLVAFSVLVCAPPALCESDTRPPLEKTVFASPVSARTNCKQCFPDTASKGQGYCVVKQNHTAAPDRVSVLMDSLPHIILMEILLKQPIFPWIGSFYFSVTTNHENILHVLQNHHIFPE